jgi:bifunctional pyridoxal-dependent enzyme with beta-cystathionase and maltose regulon repressor activities
MEFTEPQGRYKSRAEWVEKVKILKENTGKWAKVIEDCSPGVATSIRDGKYTAFIDVNDPTPRKVQMQTRWEVTTKRTSRSKNDIYMRWLG